MFHKIPNKVFWNLFELMPSFDWVNFDKVDDILDSFDFYMGFNFLLKFRVL